MTNKEKIKILKSAPPSPCCLVDYYQDILEKIGCIKYNYSDYLTTEYIDCDVALEDVTSADFDLCCELLTMLFREDHFAQYGCFENRHEKGDVQKIINRMIVLLEEKEENIKKRLSVRAMEYRMFMDD